MDVVEYPDFSLWKRISARPSEDDAEVESIVREIIGEIRLRGDRALRELAEKLDRSDRMNLFATEEELSEAGNFLDKKLKAAIKIASENIEKFHLLQGYREVETETLPGIFCMRKAVPVNRVGLYVPGGSAPLFSTVLMLGIPAKIAGCREIVIFTPPSAGSGADPAILYCANLLGIKEVVIAGGAQAIAAMAYGTESIKAVDKIFGPGNRFVTEAKLQVSRDVEIDMAAGPSELMIVADSSASAEFIAADILSQAEHGPDSQIFLLTTEKELIALVNRELDTQIAALPRRETAVRALSNGKIVLVEDREKMLEFVNDYAPEHLMLSVRKPHKMADSVHNAGSVFLGNWSAESAGDYASGPNHTLPTGRRAVATGVISLESFMHTITIQELTKEGLMAIGSSVERMAEAEGLSGHKNAISVRLKKIKNGN